MSYYKYNKIEKGIYEILEPRGKRFFKKKKGNKIRAVIKVNKKQFEKFLPNISSARIWRKNVYLLLSNNKSSIVFD